MVFFLSLEGKILHLVVKFQSFLGIEIIFWSFMNLSLGYRIFSLGYWKFFYLGIERFLLRYWKFFTWALKVFHLGIECFSLGYWKFFTWALDGSFRLVYRKFFYLGIESFSLGWYYPSPWSIWIPLF